MVKFPLHLLNERQRNDLRMPVNPADLIVTDAKHLQYDFGIPDWVNGALASLGITPTIDSPVTVSITKQDIQIGRIDETQSR